MPPSPLTADFFRQRKIPVDTLREEALPIIEDTGMTSVVTLLWIRWQRHGAEELYITKRSKGARQDSDLFNLSKELRFYKDVARNETRHKRPKRTGVWLG